MRRCATANEQFTDIVIELLEFIHGPLHGGECERREKKLKLIWMKTKGKQ